MAGVVAILSLLAVPDGRAAPIAFPGSGTNYVYTEDFNAALGTEWTLDGWTPLAVCTGGMTHVTGLGSGNGLVSTSSPSGGSWPAVYPLPAIKAADSFGNHGFDGNWLINLARPSTNGGSAIVEFDNLPVHDSLDLGFLLAAGDSIDSAALDGPYSFTLRVDDAVVFQFMFSGGGNNLTTNSGNQIVKLVGGGNLDTYYREQWNDNAGAGPSGENDRFGQGWTLDSAYDMSSYTGFVGIAHSASTLKVEFVHTLSSTYSDEYHAIENVSITLNNVVPEPATVSLLGLAFFALARRFRR